MLNEKYTQNVIESIIYAVLASQDTLRRMEAFRVITSQVRKIQIDCLKLWRGGHRAHLLFQRSELKSRQNIFFSVKLSLEKLCRVCVNPGTTNFATAYNNHLTIRIAFLCFIYIFHSRVCFVLLELRSFILGLTRSLCKVCGDNQCPSIAPYFTH